MSFILGLIGRKVKIRYSNNLITKMINSDKI